MVNKKSKYWIRKWKKADWEDFRTLEVGSTFDTTVSNHVQMADRVGDIIFWYRVDKDKKGIYFITKVLSAPKENDNYYNGWSMDLQVIKALLDKPVIPEQNGFKLLMEELNRKGQGGQNYNLEDNDNPEKLWKLVLGNEKSIISKLNTDINKKDLEVIEKIKIDNINSGKMFNPFLDMNLVKNEVRHLSFLSNLLNPNGSHFQGTLFLSLFIDTLIKYYDFQKENEAYIKDFCKKENINVQKEKNISNGRIDIWIENDEYIIAIEGKTESNDSKGQLKKYDKYLQKQNKPYLLIYLTKDGKEPINESPDNIHLMDFKEDIIDFASSTLKVESLPKKIKITLEEYHNSMIAYLNEFNSIWSYELDIINEITKNKNNYDKYENIKNNYFYDTIKYKYTVVENVANSFEKAKAKLERDFFSKLSKNLNDEIKKSGFIFDINFSDLLSIISNDENDININSDINKILKKRKARSSSVKQENIQSKTGIEICYKKKILDNEYLALFIINDADGLTLYFSYRKDEECNTKQQVELLSADIFRTNNINKLLDKKFITKLINECKEKIINTLKKV